LGRALGWGCRIAAPAAGEGISAIMRGIGPLSSPCRGRLRQCCCDTTIGAPAGLRRFSERRKIQFCRYGPNREFLRVRGGVPRRASQEERYARRTRPLAAKPPPGCDKSATRAEVSPTLPGCVRRPIRTSEAEDVRPCVGTRAVGGPGRGAGGWPLSTGGRPGAVTSDTEYSARPCSTAVFAFGGQGGHERDGRGRARPGKKARRVGAP